LWTAPLAGGDARLLVSHVANESQPSYSPDGKMLAFVSDRTGGGDIYLLTFATGHLLRLIFDDGNELVDGWSRDGQWIYYTSSSREIAGGDIYRVRASGGMPMQVSADRSERIRGSAVAGRKNCVQYAVTGWAVVAPGPLASRRV
jgi:Tol biopolymer transport system component